MGKVEKKIEKDSSQTLIKCQLKKEKIKYIKSSIFLKFSNSKDHCNLMLILMLKLGY